MGGGKAGETPAVRELGSFRVFCVVGGGTRRTSVRGLNIGAAGLRPAFSLGFVLHIWGVGGGSGQAGGAGTPRRWNRGVKLMEARFACDSFLVGMV